MKSRTRIKIKNFTLRTITVLMAAAGMIGFVALVENGWNWIPATMLGVSAIWLAIFCWANDVFES